MKRGLVAATLLLGACATGENKPFYQQLYNIAHSGEIRVGDRGTVNAARVYGIQACAALTNPDSRIERGDYRRLQELCIRPANDVEVAAVQQVAARY